MHDDNTPDLHIEVQTCWCEVTGLEVEPDAKHGPGCIESNYSMFDDDCTQQLFEHQANNNTKHNNVMVVPCRSCGDFITETVSDSAYKGWSDLIHKGVTYLCANCWAEYAASLHRES